MSSSSRATASGTTSTGTCWATGICEWGIQIARIPDAQQVAVDVQPDAVAHELLDILAIVDGWHGR